MKRVAKRVTSPALSPIDGRVADINRRIEHARVSTEQLVEAFAQSTSETCSYVGDELRRLNDLLSSREEALRGSDAQSGLWYMDERIVEIPFALAALGRLPRGARVLDIGGADSVFPISAASLGYRVTAIGPRPSALSHPNLESQTSLPDEGDMPSEPVAGAFLRSPIGDVGLGGDLRQEAGADKDLLDRVHGLLSPDGLLCLTSRYGPSEQSEPGREFDEEALNKRLAEWQILDRQFAVQREASVWEADEKLEPGSRGVVMLVASPTCSR